jgi:transposase-like protein
MPRSETRDTFVRARRVRPHDFTPKTRKHAFLTLHRGLLSFPLRSFVFLFCSEMFPTGYVLDSTTPTGSVSVMAEDYPRMLLELEKRFGDEDSCRVYLAGLRWPEGRRCVRCGGDQGMELGRGLWRCGRCGYESSVMAGTIFQDTKLPLTVWFRAMWHVTSQKNGISALGLQRVLGLGSYKTAWALLHKLRRAMVRPGRDRLTGVVEVDETYLGGLEEGVSGRETRAKSLIVIAAQEDGPRIGRVRMRRVPNASAESLCGFIAQVIEPGALVHTDGWPSYTSLQSRGYGHRVSKIGSDRRQAAVLLPRVHQVVSLLKRWLMGTHQGAVSHAHLDDYLDEFVFRFNRRRSASRGKLFYRLAQQAVEVPPAPYESLTTPKM